MFNKHTTFLMFDGRIVLEGAHVAAFIGAGLVGYGLAFGWVVAMFFGPA